MLAPSFPDTLVKPWVSVKRGKFRRDPDWEGECHFLLFKHFSQLHCCRNTLLHAQATHFTGSADTVLKRAFPVACMSIFKELLSSCVHPLTGPAACDHPWKHILSMIPSFSTSQPPRELLPTYHTLGSTWLRSAMSI